MRQAEITQPLTFAGRTFSVEELQLIQEISRDYQSLGRTEISRTLCELLEWRGANGRPKNHECRLLLERLQGLDTVSLPEILPLAWAACCRAYVSKQARAEGRRIGRRIPAAAPGGSRGSGGSTCLWRGLMERHHYLRYRLPPSVVGNARGRQPF